MGSEPLGRSRDHQEQDAGIQNRGGQGTRQQQGCDSATGPPGRGCAATTSGATGWGGGTVLEEPPRPRTASWPGTGRSGSTGAEAPAAGPSCHPRHSLPPSATRRPPANPEVQSQCPGHSFNPWGERRGCSPAPPQETGATRLCGLLGSVCDSVAHLTATDFYLFFTCIYLFFGIRLCSAPAASSPLLTSRFLPPSRSGLCCRNKMGGGNQLLEALLSGEPRPGLHPCADSQTCIPGPGSPSSKFSCPTTHEGP